MWYKQTLYILLNANTTSIGATLGWVKFLYLYNYVPELEFRASWCGILWKLPNIPDFKVLGGWSIGLRKISNPIKILSCWVRAELENGIYLASTLVRKSENKYVYNQSNIFFSPWTALIRELYQVKVLPQMRLLLEEKTSFLQLHLRWTNPQDVRV